MLSVREYVDQNKHFSDDEKQQIYENLEKNNIGKLTKLIMILTTWSVIAFFIESTLIGGGVVFSIIKGIDWKYFLPEIIFLLGNFITKGFFIHWYMKDKISLANLLYAAVPTIGPGILLGIVIKNNSLLMKALRRYINYRKNSLFNIFKK